MPRRMRGMTIGDQFGFGLAIATLLTGAIVLPVAMRAGSYAMTLVVYALMVVGGCGIAHGIAQLAG